MPWPNLQGIYMAMPKQSRKRKRPQFGVLMSMMPKRNRSGAAICGGEPAFWPAFLVRFRKIAILPLLLVIASCSHETRPIDVEKFLQDFIGAYLAMSPVTATQMGFHNYESVNLDSIL